MITVRKAADRGSVNLGWLDSKHTFSFGEYHDPDHSSEEPVHFLRIWIAPAVESLPGA